MGETVGTNPPECPGWRDEGADGTIETAGGLLSMAYGSGQSGYGRRAGAGRGRGGGGGHAVPYRDSEAFKRSMRQTSDTYHGGERLTMRGHFVATRFQNQDTGFVIGTFRPDDGREDVICKGKIAGYLEGQPYELTGDVVDDETWGIQLSIKACAAREPSTSEEMAAFLGSGIIKTLGPATAKRIVDAFGDETRDVLLNSPERLMEVKGVGRKLMERIRTEYPAKSGQQDAIGFFSKYGVSMSTIKRIIDHYQGNASAARKGIEEDPYVLTKMFGFGFTRADQIARKMGIALDDPRRLRAGLFQTLRYACQKDGHTLLPVDELMSVAYSKLDVDPGVAKAKVDAALEHLVREGDLIRVEGGIQPRYLYKAETRIKRALADAVNARHRPVLPKERLDAAMAEVRRHMAFQPTDEQEDAVRKAFTERVSLLTAAAGAGKTACMTMVTQVCKMAGIPFVLCSPTGRAAKNLSEACTPRGAKHPIPAYTIHRALGLGMGEDDGGVMDDAEMEAYEGEGEAQVAFRRAKVVLCDEASMLDTQMAAILLRKCAGKDLVLIGDPNQLPSVGPGAVLADMLACPDVPQTRLTRVFRQAAGSPVIMAANAVLAGRNPCDVPGVEFHECDNADVQATIAEFVLPRIKDEGLGYGDIAFMAPMKNTPVSGTNALNAYLRPLLNHGFRQGEDSDWKFQTGDFVSQKRNNYEVNRFNGDQGVVTSTDGATVTVRFLDDAEGTRPTSYKAAEANDNLMLAYASTIHRYQGSQCPTVVVVLTDSHFIMCTRNLLYTGITRAQERIVLIGNESAFKRAARNAKQSKRDTGLDGMDLRAMGVSQAASRR